MPRACARQGVHRVGGHQRALAQAESAGRAAPGSSVGVSGGTSSLHRHPPPCSTSLPTRLVRAKALTVLVSVDGCWRQRKRRGNVRHGSMRRWVASRGYTREQAPPTVVYCHARHMCLRVKRAPVKASILLAGSGASRSGGTVSGMAAVGVGRQRGCIRGYKHRPLAPTITLHVFAHALSGCPPRSRVCQSALAGVNPSKSGGTASGMAAGGAGPHRGSIWGRRHANRRAPLRSTSLTTRLVWAPRRWLCRWVSLGDGANRSGNTASCMAVSGIGRQRGGIREYKLRPLLPTVMLHVFAHASSARMPRH